ncbi:MAG: bifunctional pantoate--beta-alanine ligase/(d)CMP kinase [Cyanobacteria bacterium J06648_11]
MRLVRSVSALRALLSRSPRLSVGLVPTMGALHAGHASLIERSRQDCDLTVVSIFVNPLQFGTGEDFERYPQQLDRDRQLCAELEVDVLFVPDSATFQPSTDPKDQVSVVPPREMLEHLCGPWRPGHFPGVLTVVLKLLQAARPARAYFGQKDAQQLALIRRMASDLHVPVEIVACPIVRASSGLALSSRNQYLSESEANGAAHLYIGLQQAKSLFDRGERRADVLTGCARSHYQQQPQLRVQYLELVEPDTLISLREIEREGLLAVAAFVGKTRLIDNVLLRDRRPIIAIDGPAGAGKSTVARMLAASLQLQYLDTGALYRALTWLALQRDIPAEDEIQLVDLAATTPVHLETHVSPERPTRVWIGDREVTDDIRSQAVTRRVSAISALAGVRQELLRQQRVIGRWGGVVMEGRDIGTHVFPDAELKIFLTASARCRAERRQLDLQAKGETISVDELKTQIEDRDRHDSQRAIAPLRRAPDAIAIDTDALAPAEVSARIEQLYHRRLANMA